MYRRYRLCSAICYMGGGKTLLGIVLAYEFLRQGWVTQVWANIQTGFKVGNDRTGRNTFFLLDEAWQWADSRESAKGDSGYGAFLRKRKSYFFAASALETDKRLKPVRVERIGSAPLLGWLYKWQLQDGVTQGSFWLRHPEEFFGTFDTEEEPESDNGIRAFFESLKAKDAGHK